ncbi:reverse transcriptase domain-containing protein [Tanacetum coccineum]
MEIIDYGVITRSSPAGLRGDGPHMGYRIALQLDTFYNALNSNDQDSLNSTAGVSTSSSTPAVSSDVAELKDMVRALILDKKNQTSAPVKAVEQSCVTCGGAHSYQSCPATDGNVYHDNIQAYVSQAAAANFNQGNTSAASWLQPNSIPDPAIPSLCFFSESDDHDTRLQRTTMLPTYNTLSEMARTPLNESCSAVILNKLPIKLRDPGRFLIPCEFSRINTCNALADLVASINLMPYSVWKDLSLPELTPTCMTLELADRSITEPISIAKDVRLMVGKFQFPADFVVVDFEPDPRVPLILGRSFLKTSRALIDVYEGEITLRVGKEAITFNLDQTSRYNGGEMMLTYYDPEGDILILEALLNNEPLPPLPNHKDYSPGIREELKVVEAKTIKSSIDEPPEVELKDLPPHLEYAFLEGDDKLPVIIAKDLKG